jgi:Skp family chaperone for outer membrane proteins
VSQSSSPIRRLARVLIAAAALSVIGLGVQPVLAQTQPEKPAVPAQGTTVNPAQIPIVVGVLDTQAILNASSAGKSLNSQWTAQVKAMNDDMAKKEDTLRAQAQQLETARSGNPPMTPAEFATKRKGLEQQDAKFQQDFAAKKQALDAKLDKAREAITMAARKAMQDVAKARGITLILDRSAVPYSPQPWNITDEVMTRLNKALPGVKL